MLFPGLVRSRAWSRTIARGSALLVSLGAPGVAQAAEPVPAEVPGEVLSEAESEAVDAFVAQAREAFEQDDYEGAAEAFEAAYDISSDPSMLFNIGRVYEEAGQLSDAVEYYERFVHQPKVSLEHRALTQERLEVLRPLVAAAADEDTARSNGADALADDDPNPPDGRISIITGSVLAGVGGAALITGTTFAILGRSDLDGATDASTPQAKDALETRGIRRTRVGDVGFISGGIFVAAAVPLLVTGLLKRKRSRAVGWAPAPRGVLVYGRF